ncbi:MAG: hypothetical protein JSR60_02565 [Proteobacteria bacterium]|nr:hypothetical protein [Pseudomonadota bacterium]
MSFVDFSAHAVNPTAAGQHPAAAAAAQATAAGTEDDSLTFGDILDVVNPLQHFPIVGTLYRAITGDTIKTLPKIAGDALFGGIPGLASSVADSIFQKVTGKNVGDTVLAFVEDAFSSGDTRVADNATNEATPAIQTPDIGNLPVPSLPVGDASELAAVMPTPVQIPNLPVPSLPVTDANTIAAATPQDAILVPGQESLLLALNRNGVDQDVALRAADAYRRNVLGLHGSLN